MKAYVVPCSLAHTALHKLVECFHVRPPDGDVFAKQMPRNQTCVAAAAANRTPDQGFFLDVRVQVSQLMMRQLYLFSTERHVETPLLLLVACALGGGGGHDDLYVNAWVLGFRQSRCPEICEFHIFVD